MVTDHFALKWLHSPKDPSGRFACWSVHLQQYEFDVVHCQGKDHVVPDALSRLAPVIDEVTATTPNFDGYIDPWYKRMIGKIGDCPLHHPQWRV